MARTCICAHACPPPTLPPHPQVGWGFSDSAPFASDPSRTISPADKCSHLKAFLDACVPKGRPVVLVGASLGGAKALDFAHTYPEAVSSLVLIDAQGFIDGIGPMGGLPRVFAELGVKLLRTEGLRMVSPSLRV